MIKNTFHPCFFIKTTSSQIFPSRQFSSTRRISDLCSPLIEDLHQIDASIILPHLLQKTDWISSNSKDKEWMEKDCTVLSKIKASIESNEIFSHINSNLIGLIDGLIVHVKHREDILISNKDILGRRFPENGALIRALYIYADQKLIFSSIDSLKQKQILQENQDYTIACLSAELRRVIRKILRVAGSIQTANQSAIFSLVDSACVFPDRHRKILEIIDRDAYKIAKEVCSKENSSKRKCKELRRDLTAVFSNNLNVFLETRNNIPADLICWAEKNSFGLSFEELQEKYLLQGYTEDEALQKIIQNSLNSNPLVNSTTQEVTTKVTQAYIDDLNNKSPSLLHALGAFNAKPRFEVVKVEKRYFHFRSNSKIYLKKVLEKKILREPVVWEKMGLMGLLVKLDDNITAELMPGHEDNNTSIKITDGINSIYREIPEYWLENWSVKKEAD